MTTITRRTFLEGLGTASDTALAAAERALWRMMSFFEPPLADLDAAIAEDPGWLLPRVPRTVLIGTGLALTVSQWTSEPAAFGSAYDANLLVGHYVITPVVIGLLGWLLLDLWRRTRSGAPLEDEPDEVAAAAGQR